MIHKIMCKCGSINCLGTEESRRQAELNFAVKRLTVALKEQHRATAQVNSSIMRFQKSALYGPNLNQTLEESHKKTHL